VRRNKLDATRKVSRRRGRIPAVVSFLVLSFFSLVKAQDAPTPPGTPTTVAAGDVSVTIQWTAATDTVALTGYNILCDGEPIAQIGTDLQFTDTGLTPGQNYSYTVTATDQNGLTSSPSGSLSVTTSASAVPWPWTHAEIGTVAMAGSASWSGGVFTIAASGDDIWNSADAFGFAYQTLPGDGQITARVSGLDDVNAWTKAGVMLRQTLDPDSPYTFMLVSAGHGLACQSRDTAGDISAPQGRYDGAAPVWVRLVRAGSVVTGYSSVDGITWNLIAQQTLALNATLYAGLAVTSHQNGDLATATFDNVSVQPVDNDGNGLPDWWENQWGIFGLGYDAGSNINGNRFTLWEDYQGGADPNNYYSQPSANGPVTIVPALNITGGNNQTSLAGDFAPQPLLVQVTDSSTNTPLVNAPVTFTVAPGSDGQAVDRVGNTIDYHFLGATNLVPETITVLNQPGIKLSIEQQPLKDIIPGSTSPQSVITAIWDANGNKTSYTYASAPGDAQAAELIAVTTPDRAVTRYSYDPTQEGDSTPPVSIPTQNWYHYVDIGSITDPLNNTYSFTYLPDHSKLNYMNNPAVYTGYYVQSGCPRNVATVTLPDNGR